MIFIEGLPCAGKSLLVNALAEQGDSVCFELGKVLSREDFPGNGKSLDEVERINNWFISREAERMNDNKLIFYDRSYFTHLCYAYAYSRWASLDIFESTVRMYADKIADGSLPKPECVIYVDISSVESIVRQKKKIANRITKGLPEFWRCESFLNDTLYAYQHLFTSIIGIPLLVIDAKLKTEEKVSQLKQWLVNCPGSQNGNVDCNVFIDKVRCGEK
ncbi:AAA family ATPase [Serratia sp. S4]|uniref:AAA family ATPase n=1 Tax=Serratia sp. S4 TaxID=768491 RepID=UPI000370C3F5|nr:AAA family ATPase [Serratia sp. S4]